MEKKERRRALFAVYAIASLDNFGFGIVFILFAPLLLDPSYGMLSPETSPAVRHTILGVLFAVFPISQFFGAPFFGDLGDRCGRKKAFHLTIIGITLSYAFSAIAISMRNVPLLIASRLITGFFAGNLSICLAAIADLNPGEKERAKSFMVVTVVFAISWTVAMLTGGYLSDSSILPFFSPSLPLWITAFFSAMSLGVVMLFFKETHVGEKKMHIDFTKGVRNIIVALRIKEMRPFFLVLFCWTVGWGLTIQWYTVIAIQKYGAAQTTASWALLIQGAAWVTGGLIIGPLLLKKFSTRGTALVAFTFTATFLFIGSWLHDYALFTAAYWCAALTAAVCMSTSLNLVSISAPKNIQGKVMGLSESVMAIGWFFVPLIGALLANVDLNHFYLTAAIIIAFGGIVLRQTAKVRS